MGSGWENPGPAKQVVIAGNKGLLLVYSPTPGLNNLILSVAGSSGFDKYGNAYNVGLEIHGVGNFLSFNPIGSTGTKGFVEVVNAIDGGLRYEMQLIPPQDALGGSEAFLALRSNGVLTLLSNLFRVDPTSGTGQILVGQGAASDIQIQSSGAAFAQILLKLGSSTMKFDGGTDIVTLTALQDLIFKSTSGMVKVDFGTQGGASKGLKLGSANDFYKAYYEEVTLSAQVIASATAATTLQNLTTTYLENDWLAAGISAWDLANGIWTCPATGKYLWTASIQWDNWVAGSRFIFFGARNGTATTTAFMAMDTTALGGNGKGTISALKKFTVGDTVRIRAAQATGVNRTIDTAANPEMNYITTKMIA